jgi:uncharacterized SAM-binding protein YcdF (DUF218 family)
MTVSGHDDGNDHAGATRPSARSSTPRRRRHWPLGPIAGIGLFVVVLLVFGFIRFVEQLPTERASLSDNADGIVVLTGGPSRIDDAMALLAAGRGRRLLISGVHRSTTKGQISRLHPQFSSAVECCVDIDHAALNTTGNAVRTGRWVRSQGFRSLIVVTSDYHMPRAMAEIGYQLPDVTLVPFPVASGRLHDARWWTDTDSTRRLFAEYVKFLLARARIGLSDLVAVRDRTGAATPANTQAGAINQ